MEKRIGYIGTISHINSQKYNTNISCQEIPIKIYIEEPLYKLFFIANFIQEQLIIGPAKKIVVIYAVRDLTLMDL